MWKLQRERVGERELSDAQAYLTGSFPLTIETPSAIALQVLSAVFFGLDLQELQTFRERVNAVTVDDIQRVARNLHPDGCRSCWSATPSKFEKQLAGAGFDQFERISVADLDSARRRSGGSGAGAGRLRAGGFSDRERATRGAVVADDARALIDRAVRAQGGPRAR